MIWIISDIFEPTGSDINLSNLYIYQANSYYRVYIRHNKMTCFHLDNHYTTVSFYVLFVCKRVLYYRHRVSNQFQLTIISQLIDDELCKKHSQIIIVIQINLPLQAKVN